MKAIVTCGPAFEPIDSVRRITNHSTGEIGVFLSDALAAAGYEVVCYRGQLATHPGLPEKAEVIPFTTNEDLAEKLAAQKGVDAVFHAAALCDFRVKSVSSRCGQLNERGKISSSGELEMVLEPLPKVIGMLRGWFPEARIVGWKYEVEGVREDVLARAISQIRRNGTDACVANGPAFGEGFGLCGPGGLEQAFVGKVDLARCLAGL